MFWRVPWKKIKYWSKVVIVGFICYLVYRKILYKLGIFEERPIDELKTNMFEMWPFWRETPTCSDIHMNLTGEFEPDLKIESLEIVEERLAHLLQPGGFYAPKQCKAIERVAIITPIRDRPTQLPVFLKNMHSLLMKQNLDYGIFVIEQTPGQPFNRATLFNIGYVEAMKLKRWDCIIFYDVDLIPINDRNLHICSKTNPKHLSVAINNSNYKLPYENLFGGATTFTPEQFEKINGHSNLFWGWGGEDDDLFSRIRNAKYEIERYPKEIAKYVMIYHVHEIPNPDAYTVLRNGEKHFHDNGLNNLKYHIKNYKLKPTHTWILVDIIPEEMGGKSKKKARKRVIHNCIQ